eukprot:1148048-Pelagomonas_calceolata.AAC.1
MGVGSFLKLPPSEQELQQQYMAQANEYQLLQQLSRSSYSGAACAPVHMKEAAWSKVNAGLGAKGG